ncbi:TPM domain-containing protein [Desulfocurvibacter africanus]|uniref:TPM domain-containing protein n=1 Tax=Desulfocurvibacter africanus TaxID=873 RepID=UPI002FD89A5D
MPALLSRTATLQALMLLVILLLSFEACLVQALDVPPLTGRVMDLADLLQPETETWLNDNLAELERTDSTQVVVLTIPSLEGESLEEYSVRVAQAWGLGRRDFDNGVLLLVARDDRAVRIEVGYGLEGKLTDLLAGRIVDNEIVPHFIAGDFDGGVIAGVTSLAEAVRGEYQAPPGTPEGKGGGRFLGMLAFLLLISSQLGKVSRVFGGLAGGLLMAGAGRTLLGAGLLGTVFLGFFGFMAGLVVAGIFRSRFRGPRGPRGPGSSGGRRTPPIVFFPGRFPGRGGFGGGYGGGGFSGGGGGFGGGGASGRW